MVKQNIDKSELTFNSGLAERTLFLCNVNIECPVSFSFYVLYLFLHVCQDML